MWEQILPGIRIKLFMTILLGVIYPIAMTGISQVLFPKQANGSPVVFERSGRQGWMGSELIAQPFDDPGYFWTRPSGTTPAFNGAASCGSNLGPTNPALIDAVRARIAALRAGDPSDTRAVPADLVTASGSGLDPHISPAAAMYQVRRIARVRHVEPAILENLVREHTEPRQLGILGERRVNVLLLNIDLDILAHKR